MTDETNKAILTAISEHSSYLYRLSSGQVNSLIKSFDKMSNHALRNLRDLLDDMTDAELTALQSANYNTPRLKQFREEVTAWQKNVNLDLYDEFQQGAVALASYESGYIAALAGESAAVAITGEKIYKAAEKIPVTGGALVKELFAGLSEQLVTNAERTIRDGLSQGLTNAQIWREIKGRTDFPEDRSVLRQARIEIDRTARTVRNHVSNEAYIETFKALGYTHLKYVATLDGRTSKICASLDSDVWPIDSPNVRRPPLHPNCRSSLVGTDADGQLIGRRPFVLADKPVSKIPKDQRKGIIGQVNSNTSFKTWFDKDANESFKKEWLGKTKYELYKNGGYSLDKFVDPLGKEYTIAELRELDMKTFKDLGL